MRRQLEIKVAVKENFEAMIFYASLGKKQSACVSTVQEKHTAADLWSVTKGYQSYTAVRIQPVYP